MIYPWNKKDSYRALKGRFANVRLFLRVRPRNGAADGVPRLPDEDQGEACDRAGGLDWGVRRVRGTVLLGEGALPLAEDRPEAMT